RSRKERNTQHAAVGRGIRLVEHSRVSGGPLGGDAPIVVEEMIVKAEFLGDAILARPIGAGGDAMRPSRPARRAACRERAAGPAGDFLAKTRKVVLAFTVADRPTGDEILQIGRFETEALDWER